jgi:hypothetical protein
MLDEDIEAPTFAYKIDPIVNYKEDWIIDLKSSNHMTNNKKLKDMAKYKGRRVFLWVDNSGLSKYHVGKVVGPRNGPQQVQLEKVIMFLT